MAMVLPSFTFDAVIVIVIFIIVISKTTAAAARLIKCVSMTLVLNTMGRDFTDKALLHFINTLLAAVHLHRAAF